MHPTRVPRNCPIRTALTGIDDFICWELKIINDCTSSSYILWQCAWKLCYVLHNHKENSYAMTTSHHSWVTQKDSSIIWSAIFVQQAMNFTLSSLHYKYCEKRLKYISLYFKCMDKCINKTFLPGTGQHQDMKALSLPSTPCCVQAARCCCTHTKEFSLPQ